MAKPPITSDLAVRHAEPRSKPYKLGAGSSMYLLVTPQGSKLWRFKYRINGREKLMSLGSYPLISLAEARKRRDQARLLLFDGLDPMVERKAVRKQTLTFGTVAERWYKNNTVKAAKPWAPNTVRKVRLYLDKDILPILGERLIAEITRPDLIAISDQLENRGAFDIARKVRGWLAAIFDDAFDRGEVLTNPALRLRAGVKAKGIQVTPRPTVSYQELPELLKKIDAANTARSIKLAVRLLLLTAVRPGELRLATWDEFDLQEKAWDIPAERMKMRKAHSVPLPSQAIPILEQLKAISFGSVYVLPGLNPNKPISDNTINSALRKAGYGGKQTAHGLRHLISTELNERGYQSDWIEAQLAHKTVSSDLKRGMGADRSTYNHAVYWEQRVQMMQEWADSIEALETSQREAKDG